MSVSSSIFVRRPHIMPKRFTFKAPVKIISSVLISLIPWKIGYTVCDSWAIIHINTLKIGVSVLTDLQIMMLP
jgi:hypothetical protein